MDQSYSSKSVGVALSYASQLYLLLAKLTQLTAYCQKNKNDKNDEW